MQSPQHIKRTISFLRKRVIPFPKDLKERIITFFDVFEEILRILTTKNSWAQVLEPRWERHIPTALLRISFMIVHFEAIQEECVLSGRTVRDDYLTKVIEGISEETTSVEKVFRLFLATCGEGQPEDEHTEKIH